MNFISEDVIIYQISTLRRREDWLTC